MTNIEFLLNLINYGFEEEDKNKKIRIICKNI